MKNVKNADSLSEFIKDNYGIVGSNFVKVLFADKFGNIEQLYQEARNVMRDYVSENMNDLTERLINTYAVTYITVTFLKRMGMAIDPNEVAMIMAEHNLETA